MVSGNYYTTLSPDSVKNLNFFLDNVQDRAYDIANGENKEGTCREKLYCSCQLSLSFFLSFLGISLQLNAQTRIYDLWAGDQSISVLGGSEYDQITYSFWPMFDMGPYYNDTLAHGDVNGDGYEDLIIGAPRADFLKFSLAARQGEVYVIFGKDSHASGIETVDIFNGDEDLAFARTEVQDQLGGSVVAADVNGDGIDDIIIGSPAWSNPLRARVYIILGMHNFPKKIFNLDDSNDTALLQVIEISDGIGTHNDLGASVAAGRINNDLFYDVIIGNPGADIPPRLPLLTGKAYILYGGSSLPQSIDISQANPVNWRRTQILADIAQGNFGYGIATGHVDQDSLADIVIGAPHAHINFDSVGVSYLIFGSDTLPDTIDLAQIPPGVCRINGDNRQAYSCAGSDNTCGDVDGDGFDDIVIGAPEFGGPLSLVGAAYVVKGRLRASFPATIELSQDDLGRLVKIVGTSNSDWAGSCVHSADLNNDTFSEIFIAAEWADGPGNTRPQAGDIYVFNGNALFFSNTTMTTDMADIFIYGWTGPNGGIQLGSGMTTVDLNGDGCLEIACGASLADVPPVAPDRPGAGMVFVINTPDLLRHRYPSNQFPLPVLNPGVMASIFSPEGNLDPILDLYQSKIHSGFDDPDTQSVSDHQWPLVFYQVTILCDVLKMIKSPNSIPPDNTFIRYFF